MWRTTFLKWSHSSPSGGRWRGEVVERRTALSSGQSAFRRSRRLGLRRLIWWSRTLRPKLPRRMSRSSTGHSRWRSRRCSREILLALCPRRDAFASLLMLLCRENPVDYVRRSPSGRAHVPVQSLATRWVRLQIMCVVEYSPRNAGFKS
jgi:hypothetical protein